MKKKLSVICLAFLGIVAMQNVLAVADNKNGIMKESYILDKQSQREKKAQEKEIKEDVQEELFIEEGRNQIFKSDLDIGDVFLADPKIADIQTLDSQSFYLRGESPGVTYLKFYDKNGDILGNYVVRVTYRLDEIKKAISEVCPDLELDFVSINDQLMVKGEVPSPEMARDVIDIVGRFVKSSDAIINKLTIATATQVMLKVKIAEVKRTVSKSLGVSWRALTSNSGALIGMSTYKASNLPAGALSGDKLPGNSEGGEWVVSAGLNNLAALIDATASENLSTILAEPNLVALSGQKAEFKSGGTKFVTSTGTNGSGTTEDKPWGTILEFTPVVLSEDRINIDVKAEVSSVEQDAAQKASGLTSKTVKTVVELGSGQSMILAGLLQKDQSEKTIETPFLADIPLIGSFFKSASPEKNETELVIVVTPYIVKPSSKKLKTPVDTVPKMLSPLKSITKRRFTSVDNKSADSAGFSIK
jgi:pilus assembly protein CpaC